MTTAGARTGFAMLLFALAVASFDFSAFGGSEGREVAWMGFWVAAFFAVAGLPVVAGAKGPERPA